MGGAQKEAGAGAHLGGKALTAAFAKENVSTVARAHDFTANASAPRDGQVLTAHKATHHYHLLHP